MGFVVFAGTVSASSAAASSAFAADSSGLAAGRDCDSADSGVLICEAGSVEAAVVEG